MLRILLVKTSSLGDVVHNFPVVTDIRCHFPDAAIDWVVEEAYVGLVRLHPAVRHVVPVALRRWRQRLLKLHTWQDIGAFRRLSRSEHYDAVIDTQGLLKSALVSRSVHGRSHGFDASSARESMAARFYDTRHHVRRNQHAVVRNRQLAAAALGYRLEGQADYGLQAQIVEAGRYCVFLHGSSRADKLWPASAWVDLGRRLEERGVTCVLPWGTEGERARSQRIAEGLRQADVPEFLTLEKMARLLAGASAVVGVDTGLVHLAAALKRPAVAIFVGSDPGLTGLYGAPCSRNLGSPGAAPAADAVMDALLQLQAV